LQSERKGPDVTVEVMELDYRILFRDSKELAPAPKPVSPNASFKVGRMSRYMRLRWYSIRRAFSCAAPLRRQIDPRSSFDRCRVSYGGDDIVLIAADCVAAGIPFSAAVKSGASQMISMMRSCTSGRMALVYDIYKLLTCILEDFDRMDNFSRRAEGALSTLTSVGQIEAMKRLIEERAGRGPHYICAAPEALLEPASRRRTRQIRDL
jgi:hypothetical protein